LIYINILNYRIVLELGLLWRQTCGLPAIKERDSWLLHLILLMKIGCCNHEVLISSYQLLMLWLSLVIKYWLFGINTTWKVKLLHPIQEFTLTNSFYTLSNAIRLGVYVRNNAISISHFHIFWKHGLICIFFK